jgi:hypothetical protein
MNGIEKQAAFYRGYLPDDRSLVPLMIVLTTSVVLWLLVYVVSAVSVTAQHKVLLESTEDAYAVAVRGNIE